MSNGRKYVTGPDFHYRIRNPRWRVKHYLKVWGASVIICVLLGWFTNGFNGVVTTVLMGSAVQVALFALWEWGERQRDREWEETLASMDDAIADSIRRHQEPPGD